MTTSHKKPGVAFWATVVVGTALTAYPVSYAFMVTPKLVTFSSSGRAERIEPDYTGGTPLIGTRDQTFWERVFTPAHWADRRIRPETWSVRMPPSR